MKKILSFVLASAMVASMAVTAFAASEYHHTGADKAVPLATTPTIATYYNWGALGVTSVDGVDNYYFDVNNTAKAGKKARELAEGSAKVDSIVLAAPGLYKSLADFEKDYSFSYKIKKGPVASVALKYDADQYKAGEGDSTVKNNNYQAIKIEIKFNKLFDTTVSTEYEIEFDLKDKVANSTLFNDQTVQGSIVNEAYKPVDTDELELTFDGYAGIVDFGNLKNSVTDYKYTFCNNDGDDILDVAYKGVQTDKLNFTYNFYQNAAIVNKYADVDFEFINFVASPKLAKVANISFFSDNAKGGVFAINADGTFSNVGAKYNATTKAYEFKSATLGSFFVASDASKIITAPVSSSASSSSSATGGKENVNTGASDIVNVAVVMSVVSLAAAGAVAFKKASK